MRTYKAGAVPEDPSALTGFLRRETLSIQQAAQRAEPFVLLQVLYAEPEKTQAGMVIFADGVTFDPGSGEGLYRRNVANDTWIFIA